MILNVWLSVIQPALGSPNPFKFPRKVQDPDTEKRITINNIEELWKVIENWKINHYLYSTMIAHPTEIIDSKSQELISQYHYCKDFSLSPYSGSYQNQPAFWIDAVNIIKRETNNATEYLRKKNGS